MKALQKILLMLVIILTISINGYTQDQKAYAYVNTYTYLNLREGPSSNYSVVKTLKNGEVVEVINLDTYADGWVRIKTSDGKEGYVSTKYLLGNYVDQFKSQTTEKYRSDTFYDKIYNSFFNFIYLVSDVCKSLFYKTYSLGGWSIVIVLFLIALSIGVIVVTRFFDDTYSYPFIYYLLYFVAILPMWGFCALANQYGPSLNLSGRILLFLITMIPALINIHGGWGVRQSGMIQGKHYDNINYYIGQLLLFPVWLMLAYMFWNTIIIGFLQWSETFEYCGGGFLRFVLGLLVATIIVSIVLLIWATCVVRLLLKPMGKLPLYIVTIMLWWALVRICYNWAYANFNDLGFIFIILLGSIFLFAIISNVLLLINERRCPMCHDIHGYQSDLTDEGISTSTSVGWYDTDSSRINPRHAGADVTDARKKVITTVLIHSWNTEHTCPKCGCKWTISHSEEVGRRSRVLERRWTERY